MIKNIEYSELSIWDIKGYFKDLNVFSDKYPLLLFGKFLSKPNIEKVKIEDSETYKILGVRSYGKGAYTNRIVLGKTLKMRTYQLAKENHLFWCKVDTKNGAFGVITEDLADGVASSNMTFAEIDNEKAINGYVQLLFLSPRVNAYMDSFVTGTTNRKYIRPDQLFNEIKIPLPSIPEQTNIVEAYNKRIKEAEDQEVKAKELQDGIESYLFEALGIKKKKQVKKSGGLNFISFEDTNVWGADRLLRGGDNSVLHSSIYPNKKLSEVTFVNPRTDLSNLKDNDEMSFIPMECVSDEYGEVMELREGQKANSKGYTKFQEGDLIWARITPCMQNGKSAIVSNLSNGVGYGSTEYHVIREKDSSFSVNYAHTLLRRSVILNDAVNYFTGSAGQQRVPKSYLENLEVPVPPLSKQNEIIATISEMRSEIKALQEKAAINREQAIKEFEQEIFEV